MTNLTEEQKNEVINFIEKKLPEEIEIKIKNGIKTGFVSDKSMLSIYNSYGFKYWLYNIRKMELRNRIIRTLPFINKIINKNKFPVNIIQQRLDRHQNGV